MGSLRALVVCPSVSRSLYFGPPASIIPRMKKHFFSHTLFGFRLSTLVICAAFALIGVAALGLDLLNHGLIYEYFWDVTGETEPDQQLLGFGQVLMRYTRQQPDTQPYAHVEHADVNPFGVNTFLDQEVELSKREQQMQMIADGGFHWIRQQFRWADLEIHAKGDFVDRRNDPNGVNAWDKYDHIVDLAEQYGIEIIARLSDPPAWSQAPGTENNYTPPADYQDFVDYATAVAGRYQGRISYYQVWNEPNLYPEWGNQTVNAEAYTDLLCRTYHALKEVDPQIVVITGALGPTIDLSGRDAYDLLYLQRMYQAGAGACFDILSMQGYGLWSGPTDQRLRPVTINFQRVLWIRDMMVKNGDAHKAIWISEAGWNPVPNDPTIANLDQYGRVTMDQAAEWAALAYERAIKDWPWVGVVNWWYLKRADEAEKGQSWYYFRLLEPNFTPTPVYESLKAYMTGDQPKILGAGRHGLDSRGMIGQGEDGRETRTYRFDGTSVSLCAADPPETLAVAAILDGESETLLFTAGLSGCVQVCGELDSGTHTLVLSADSWEGLDSLAVIDHTARHRLPWLLVGILAALGVLLILGSALDQRLS
ncbi:MAG: hypothetical protein HY866_23760, partial [Chloroflexi bacterium]|nr:hypothetical protein [Chloroflexota bacterium]